MGRQSKIQQGYLGLYWERFSKVFWARRWSFGTGLIVGVCEEMQTAQGARALRESLDGAVSSPAPRLLPASWPLRCEQLASTAPCCALSALDPAGQGLWWGASTGLSPLSCEHQALHHRDGTVTRTRSFLRKVCQQELTQVQKNPWMGERWASNSKFWNK